MGKDPPRDPPRDGEAISLALELSSVKENTVQREICLLSCVRDYSGEFGSARTTKEFRRSYVEFLSAREGSSVFCVFYLTSFSDVQLLQDPLMYD